MARDKLTVNDMPGEGNLKDVANAAITAANGFYVEAVEDSEELLVRVENTNGAATTRKVTFKAGVNPPAFRAGLGDLAFDVPAGEVHWFGPFSSARFKQADGQLYIDGAHAELKFAAFRVPRTV